MDSPCVSSDNESEQSINLRGVACIPDDDDREPLATEEVVVRYNGNMEREAVYVRRVSKKIQWKTEQRYTVRHITIFTHPYCCIKFL